MKSILVVLVIVALAQDLEANGNPAKRQILSGLSSLVSTLNGGKQPTADNVVSSVLNTASGYVTGNTVIYPVSSYVIPLAIPGVTNASIVTTLVVVPSVSLAASTGISPDVLSAALNIPVSAINSLIKG